MANQYQISVQSNNQVALSGDLTMYSIHSDWLSHHQQQTLGSLKKSEPITFDLAKIQRIDSAGLAWLVNIVRDVKAAGFSLIFTNTPSELLNLAKISDVSTLLPLE